MGRLIRHELLDLPPHRTVPAVLDGVVRAPGTGLGDVGPARAAPRVAPQDDLVLGGRPGQLADVGVQLVVPPLRHCLPVRPGRCAARTDHLRVPWPSIARSRSSSSAGDQAPLTCVACGACGGLAASLARPKELARAKNAAPSRSQRARECGEFVVGCEAARGSVSCVSGGNSRRRRSLPTARTAAQVGRRSLPQSQNHCRLR